MTWRTRSPNYGANGMVATSQTTATQVGLDILKRGGSAIDAALAANACLSLAEPHMCGPGGDLFAIIWDPKVGTPVGLNASGRSPAALSYETFTKAVGEPAVVPARGPLSVTVPGAVDGWCALHERYGRLPLQEVWASTIALARNGVAIGQRTSQMWGATVAALTDDPLLEGLLNPFLKTYGDNGNCPNAGQVFTNADLANTYEVIAEHGRDGFYGQEIGGQLSSFVTASGGYLSIEDLRGPHADWIGPLQTNYRGVDVFELPPNGQGLTVLQLLNILEDYPLRQFGYDSADYWHAFIESKKLVFEDRARYFADPAFNALPVNELLSKDYAAKRRQLIDVKRAARDFSYGDVSVAGSDTTYLTVADNDGMMVSLIQSIFSPFGSGLVPPGLGFALQCRGAGFSLEAGHPNVYAPGKRPFHTIIPAFAMREGAPWMSFGVMGADMQPQGQAQVLANMIDFDMDPQAAGDAPRMRHFGGRQPNGEVFDGLGVVQYERGIDGRVIADLTQRGHRMERIESWIDGFTGGYQCIQYDPQMGVYVGASEPRLDGSAQGY